MKLNKFLLLLLLAQLSIGQTPTTGKIEGITQNGLHKIVVSPAIRSFSQEQLQDFRIFDSKHNEVPYYIAEDKKEDGSLVFEAFEILSKTIVPHKSTSIVFANPGKVISEVTLSVANANISKNYSISGSDDQKEWFGLVNKAQLADLENTTATSDYKQLTLPLSAYRFLRIDIDDKKTLPINILQIGRLVSTTNSGSFLDLSPKNTVISQVKNEKKTLIHVTFDTPQIIDKISFTISAPSFYKRQVRVYKKVEQKVRKRTEIYEQELAVFELNSARTNSFEDLGFFEKDFFISIENRDNPALSIDPIKFSQVPLFVVADLKSGEKYTVSTGNSSLTAPDYDLSYFKNQTNDHLPEATITMVHQLQREGTGTKAPDSFWQQSWFLWTCISLAGIAILYFAISLIKDMN